MPGNSLGPNALLLWPYVPLSAKFSLFSTCNAFIRLHHCFRCVLRTHSRFNQVEACHINERQTHSCLLSHFGGNTAGFPAASLMNKSCFVGSAQDRRSAGFGVIRWRPSRSSRRSRTLLSPYSEAGFNLTFCFSLSPLLFLFAVIMYSQCLLWRLELLSR